MVLSRNHFDQLEVPQFVLCKASKERVGVIKAVEKSYSRKADDLDEISFTLYLNPLEHYAGTKEAKFYEDDFDPAEYNAVYKALDVMKYVEVPTIGRFAITNVATDSEGTRNENKQVTAQSYEVLMGQKYIENFIFNKGTIGSVEYKDDVSQEVAYPLYTDGISGNDLFYYVLEKFPEWSVGHVDESLKGKIRSFEVDSQDVYSFLTEDVAQAYECYFVFDTLSMTINAYALEKQGEHDTKYDTNIHISYNNLLKSTNISCDIDSIKTCLKVQGDSDDVVLREINMGQDRIYNFDYFATPEYMSDELIANYKKWVQIQNDPVDLSTITFQDGTLTEDDIKGQSNKDAYSTLLQMEYQLYLKRAVENDSKMPYESNQRYIGYGTFMTDYSYPTTTVTTCYPIAGQPIYSRTWLTTTKGSSTPLIPKENVAYSVWDEDNNQYTGYRWDDKTNSYKRLDVITFEIFTRTMLVKDYDTLSAMTGDKDTLYIIGQFDTNNKLVIPDDEGLYRYDPTTSKYYNVNIWDGYALVPYQEKLKTAQRQVNLASKSTYGDPSQYVTFVKPAENGTAYASDWFIENTDSQEAVVPTVAANIGATYLDVTTNKKYQWDFINRKYKDISDEPYTTNLYLSQYVPALYTQMMLEKKVSEQSAVVKAVDDQLSVIIKAEQVIASYVDIKKWLTKDNLTELSAFIREDELSTDYFTLTDSMSEDQRSEMLHGLMDYASEELQRVSMPEMTFTAEMVDLFALPEFDSVSMDNADGIAGGFDIRKYIWITLRDDYSVKAKITEIDFNFLDPSDFTVTFSNIVKKKADIYTDLQDAINTATSAATTVTFNEANWNQTVDAAESIHTALQNGLLSAGYYLQNAANSELVIDDRGIFVDTISTTDPDSSMYGHGKGDANGYDSIYIGGGRILFTDDGWKTVSMSVGRGDVMIPDPTSLKNGAMKFNTQSRFGVFADYVIAGYIAGSTMTGGQLYSDNFAKGTTGSHIDLEHGTLEFYSSQNGKQTGYLTLDENGNLSLSGDVHANTGTIGDFHIGTGIYTGSKSSFTSQENGVYIGTDGIALGNNKFTVNSEGKLIASDVDLTGKITATSGKIGNTNINADGSISSANGNFKIDAQGNTTVKGAITATSGKIGNVTINADGSISNGSFSVSKDGALTAGGDSTFSGSLSAATGTFKGDITGSNGHFTGTIDCENLTGTKIKGKTIEGGKFTTSSVWNSEVNENNCVTIDGNWIQCDRIWIGATSAGTVNIGFSSDTNGQAGEGLVCSRNFATEPSYNSYSGDFVRYSDRRLKENIHTIPMEESKKLIFNARPVSYVFKSDKDKKVEHGFVAQEIEPLVSDHSIVRGGINGGYYSLSYEQMIADMVNVIQDQEKRIQALENKD